MEHRKERTAINAYHRDLRLLFQSYLKRPDDKQIRLTTFQQAFNAIETDMRFDDDTKAELHLRNEELRDALWKIVCGINKSMITIILLSHSHHHFLSWQQVETRRMDAKVLLHSCKTNGWLPLRVAALQLNLIVLIQLEADRFQATFHALNDYVDATMANPINEEGLLADLDSKPEEPKKGAPKKSAKEIKAELEALGPPRTILPPNVVMEGTKNVVKAINEAVTPPAPPDPKVSPKKASAESKGKNSAATLPAEPSPDLESGLPVKLTTSLATTAQLAMALADKYSQASYRVPPTTLSYFEHRTAEQWKVVEAKHRIVWYEASRLRQAVERIIDTGARMQASLVRACDEIYAEVDGWIERQATREMASIEELVRIIRVTIEAELSLEYDLRLTNEELEVDHNLRHTPEVVHFSTSTDLTISDDAFNVDQSQEMDGIINKILASEVPALTKESMPEGKHKPLQPLEMSTTAFVDALSRLAIEDSHLPESWAKLSVVGLVGRARDLGALATDTVSVDTFQRSLAHLNN